MCEKFKSKNYCVFRMRKEVENWFEQAEDDFDKAQILFDNKKFDGAVFFCQQAVEKALKAKYIEKYGELIRVHDLVFLARKIDLPEELVHICDKLTRVYTEIRYPADNVIPAKKFSENSVKEFLKITKKVFQWLK